MNYVNKSITMKKSIIVSMMLLCASISISAQSSNVTVSIKEIEKKKGAIYVMLYNNAEGFPKEKDKAYKIGKVTEFGDEASYTFQGIPLGSYALTFFQDEDGNGELNTNFIGIPKEPVGASNMTRFGKPSYNKCVFVLEEENVKMELKFIM